MSPLAKVLQDHMRGDWSDWTYSCQGCRNRYEEAEQARFDAMDREPTRAELIESRNGYSDVSHPGWTLEQYHEHVADEVVSLLLAATPTHQPDATPDPVGETSESTTKERGDG